MNGHDLVLIKLATNTGRLQATMLIPSRSVLLQRNISQVTDANFSVDSLKTKLGGNNKLILY